MGNLGRRIGKNQNTGDSADGANGNLGGGIVDFFAKDYFSREGSVTRSPGAPPPTPIDASGGTTTTYSNYKVHTFTSTGAFVVNNLATGSKPNNVEVLVVAGGGGGGGRHAGGGGGGGFRTGSRTLTSTGPITVTVGAGGNGAPESTGGGTGGTQGGTSNFARPSP